MDALKQALGVARDKAHDEYQTRLHTVDKCFADVSKIVEAFNQTGICAVSEKYEEYYKSWLPGIGMISSTLRDQATKDGRAFMLLRGGIRYSVFGGGITQFSHLTVPNSKRLDGVVAALLVVSHEIHPILSKSGGFALKTNASQIIPALTEKPVVRVNTPRQWHFFFNEDAATKGPELFLHFSEMCRTDPVFRIALRLQ